MTAFTHKNLPIPLDQRLELPKRDPKALLAEIRDFRARLGSEPLTIQRIEDAIAAGRR